jgi:hypothetical protein
MSLKLSTLTSFSTVGRYIVNAIPRAFLLAAIFAASVGQANASIMQFDISGLDSIGPNVRLGFDFIDGDGPSNTVRVGNINTDGTAGPVTLIGGASASAGGYLLEDSVFYTSLLLEYSGATQLSLRFETTNNAPAPGMFADMLAIYVLDVSSGLPSIFTDEPLGTNALMSWTASGIDNGDVLVYGPLSPVPVTWTSMYLNDPNNPVPEPSALPLLAIGLVGLLVTKSLRKEG